MFDNHCREITCCNSIRTCTRLHFCRILTRNDETGLEANRASCNLQPDACANLSAIHGDPELRNVLSMTLSKTICRSMTGSMVEKVNDAMCL